MQNGLYADVSRYVQNKQKLQQGNPSWSASIIKSQEQRDSELLQVGIGVCLCSLPKQRIFHKEYKGLEEEGVMMAVATVSHSLQACSTSQNKSTYYF